MNPSHGFMYEGIGKDGKYRITKFDFHAGRVTMNPKTAQTIAKALGFKNGKEMKEYLDKL